MTAHERVRRLSRPKTRTRIGSGLTNAASRGVTLQRARGLTLQRAKYGRLKRRPVRGSERAGLDDIVVCVAGCVLKTCQSRAAGSIGSSEHLTRHRSTIGVSANGKT